MRITWTGSSQVSPQFGLLNTGEQYEVPAATAEAWIASGHAERVRDKSRREAAPKSVEE